MKGTRAIGAAVRGAHNDTVRAVCRSSSAIAQRNIATRSPYPSRLVPSGAPPANISQQRVALTSLSKCRQSSDDASLKDGALDQTALHELHVTSGGKMVAFGGYSMPVQYTDLSVGESHKWTREKASLFDVGHMCAFSPHFALADQAMTISPGYSIDSRAPAQLLSSKASLPPQPPLFKTTTQPSPASFTLPPEA